MCRVSGVSRPPPRRAANEAVWPIALFAPQLLFAPPTPPNPSTKTNSLLTRQVYCPPPRMKEGRCGAPRLVPLYAEVSILKRKPCQDGKATAASHPFSGWWDPSTPLRELERNV